MNSIFEKYGRGDYLIFKISLLAREKVGKKTLLKTYFKDNCVDQSGVTGLNYIIKDLQLYGKGIRISVWVFSSEDQYRKLFRNYINGSSGVILMYDITNRETLNNLSEWCEQIKNYLDYDVPILLVGNKSDLENDREVLKKNRETFKDRYDISSSMEISLKTGENVEYMFNKLTEMILKKLGYA